MARVRVLRATNAGFDDQVGVVRLLDALLPELGEAMTGAFTESSAAGRELDRVAEALGGTLVDAFRNAAFEGESFRDVLLKIIQDILVLSQSSVGGGAGGGCSFLGGLFDSLLGGLFGGGGSAGSAAFAVPTIPIAKGNVFLRGRTLPEALAQGGVLHNGVVNRPTPFAMARISFSESTQPQDASLMPDLETLDARIEADLSAPKRGVAGSAVGMTCRPSKRLARE